jgi:light-regulated signal transduction histidine kinase (bacteriophytochrome)
MVSSPELTIRLLQEELAETNREVLALTLELEKRVEERTAALEAAREELERKNTRLEAVNKELEAFSYSVSHDLRAPLRHIQGYAEMLQHECPEPLDPQARDYLARIARAVERMHALIDDVLNFARTAKQPLQLAAVDFQLMVAELVAELRPEQGARSIEWLVLPLPTVRGDARMLRQAWMNLLSNAVKYTRRTAQARIEVGCRLDRNREWVCFVKDNGTGFDMKQAERLFGLFQRLHDARDFEGTGVGLANVRRIVDRHGGRTWAEGQVGRGATFYFSLPA